MVVTERSGGRHGLAIRPDCEVTLGLERITLAELRQFDDAQVSYIIRSDGNWEAGQIDARRPAQTDRWTLTIAVQNYSDAAVPRVNAAIADAQRLHTTFRQRYAVAESRGFLLLDPPREAFRQRVESVLRDATRQTQVVVTIIAYAYLGADDRVYLLPQDARSGDPAATGIALDDLAEQFNACISADKLLCLECPPAGATIDPKRMLVGAAMLDRLKTNFVSTTVIVNCRGDQQSRIVPETQAGYFGTLLVDAFRGAADTDRDLHLTPRELHSFLDRESATSAARTGGAQMPVVIVP